MACFIQRHQQRHTRIAFVWIISSHLVSQVVLLHFSIGKVYQEEIWCDVLPIDTCYVLLG